MAAKDKLDWEAGSQLPGRVVAELSLGFWVALFARGYEESLWRTALYRCFDPTPARRQLHKQLNRLRRFRNRVAHHEPILSRDLQTDYESERGLIGGQSRRRVVIPALVRFAHGPLGPRPRPVWAGSPAYPRGL